MDDYIIELSKSLSNGIRRYLADQKQRPLNEVTRKDIADELFDIVLTEIDWNLKYKLPKGTSWEFYVTPNERKKSSKSNGESNLGSKAKI
jgi:hypothetical protein